MRTLRRRVLGIPAAIRADPGVLAIARDALAAWPATRARPDLRLRVATADFPGSAETRYEIRGDRLRITAPGVLARIDGARGTADIRLGAAALADPAQLRWGVLEAALLFLATQRDRIPFHAAGVVREGRAVLLAGPSGAGKSTLALALLRRGTGWHLLSEDCVYLETRRRRIWGWPGFLHIAPDTRRFFPDLAATPVRTAAGKRKLAVRDTGPSVRHAAAGPATLVLLHRSRTGPRLADTGRDEAITALTARLEPGFDRFADRLPAALTLLDGTVFAFDAGSDPARAAAALEAALQSGLPTPTLPGA